MADSEEQPPVDPPTEEAPAENTTEDQAENITEAADAEPPQDAPPAEEQPEADAAVTADEEPKPDEEGDVKESQPEAAEPEASEAKPEGEDGQAAVEQEDGVTEEQPEPAEGEAPPQADGEGQSEPADGEIPPTDENAEEVTTEVKESAGDEEAISGEGEKTDEAPPKDEGEEGEVTEKTEENQEEVEAEASPEPAGDDLEGLPESDTFADGAKPESPAPHVGEVLSREGSPKPAAEDEHAFTPPVPKSPREEAEGDETFDVQDLEEEIISPEQDRETLVEMYHQAIAEREQFQQQNHQLQHKLAEYFKKKKSDEQKSEAVDKNEADQEQRYLKYMSQLEELRAEDQQIREEFAIEIEELQRRCEEKQEEVEAHRAKFVEFKHQVALNALNSRSGKPIQPRDIEQYLSGENRKDQEVVAVRLENIKLKNKLKKKEQQLKSKEELADGLHLIDFEQLKIENQTYNEKIEERNEELLKLRKNITNTVQVLTHLKEKLQYVQGENNLLKNKLKDVESSVAQKRDVLTRTKQARDALRIDNHKLRQNCGLLGNEPLLRDFEERKDEADNLRERLERLKMQHAELTLNSATVRRKIAQIKTME